MVETTMDSEAVLAQFNRLIQELLRGTMNRNCFRPWEIELLLDIENCQLRETNRRETLRRYQKAVQRAMEKGTSEMPFKFSDYVEMQRSRKVAMAPGVAAKETDARRSANR